LGTGKRDGDVRETGGVKGKVELGGRVLLGERSENGGIIVATTMSPLRRTISVRAFPNPDSEDAPVTRRECESVIRRLGYALS